MSSIIHLLDNHVINKIAAGEVVQRPASVVKELIDNAIDAGATSIKLETIQAGRALIRLQDNGCGMGSDDLALCFQRHATSKISELQDLSTIRTMGFRGEAMASIAAVSQVRVQTKRVEDAHGWRFDIWAGEEKTLEPDAVENGTQFSIQHLFFNVPARRQFLKTDATEFRHILRIVQQTALAYPKLKITWIADQDVVYDLPEQSLEDRIVDLFGKQYRPNLISIAEETSYLKMQGVIADPAFGKKSRGEQFLFVNGRPFQDRLLTYQILKEYEYWKKPGEYPFYAIFLEIAPEKVDVNVHPSKMEVKFEDERSVYRLVTTVVKKAINSYRHIPDISYEKDSSAQSLPNFSGNEDFQIHPSERADNGSYHFGSQDLSDKDSMPNFGKSNWQPQRTYLPNDAATRLYGDLGLKDYDNTRNNLDATSQHTSRQTVITSGIEKPENIFSNVDRVLWQLHQSYIVTQTASGLSLIDQHAAHKRILFEQALQSLDAVLPGTQQLLFAQTLSFSKSEYILLKEVLPLLQRIGFSIQLMSGTDVMISGVPSDIEVGDERSAIEGILEEYHLLGAVKELAPEHRMAVALAEQTAIKKGKRLSQTEMEHIIDRLFACEAPYIDPKGKPTIQVITLDEIQKRFKGRPNY
jgi:DNA mismatch repair protein MutL